MATNLPGALDDGTTLILTMVATTPQSNPSHSLQTVNVNGATQQIENALASATNKLYRSNGATVLGAYSSTVTVNDSTGVITLTLSQNGSTISTVVNANAGASAIALSRADNGTIKAEMLAYGTANTGVVGGLADNNSVAAYISNATAGTLFGTTANGPLYLITNNVNRASISGAGVMTIASAPILSALTGTLVGNGASAVTAVAITSGGLMYGSGAGVLANLAIGGTTGGVLNVLSGLPSWSTVFTVVDSTGAVTQTLNRTGILNYLINNPNSAGYVQFRMDNDGGQQGAIFIGGSTVGTVADRNVMTIRGTTSLRLQYSTTDRILINSTGIGFFNVTPAGQQTLTNPTTLAELRTALVNLGLCV